MRATIVVLVSALLLAGCGGAIDRRGERTAPARTAARPPASRPVPPPIVPPRPDPPRSVPTRLVGGPVVLRLPPPRHPSDGGVRYALVFRLNRGALNFLSPSDPTNPDPVPDGAGTRVGDVVFGTNRFIYDSPFGVLRDPRTGNDRDHCFAATLGLDPEAAGDDREQIAALERLPPGAHTRVRIQPLDPRGRRSGRLGRSYTRHPAIRRVGARSTPNGIALDAGGRRILRRIGCTTGVL